MTTSAKTVGRLALLAGLGAAGALAAGAVAAAGPMRRRMASIERVDPSLRSPLLYVPLQMTSRALRPLGRADLSRFTGTPEGVTLTQRDVPGPPGAPEIRVVVIEPPHRAPDSPALLWIHGGGLLFGNATQDLATCARYARQTGALVVSTNYRFAPEHPFPAARDDCFAVWQWLTTEASLGIDPARVAVGGASAGGGLAAALAQVAIERGAVQPCLQLLVYPMLDDRTVLRADHAGTGEFIWTAEHNRVGWTAYLGAPPRWSDAPAGAVPARQENLAGLPPAWIGVGALDLFHAEDVDYARRLRAAGVPVELVEVPGAYHGFDVAGVPPIVQAFNDSQVQALRAAFGAAD